MASKSIMTITSGGETYRIDFTKLMYTEAKLLQKHTGLTVQSIGPALKDQNMDAMAFLLWLSRKRSGDTVAWNDFDFDILDLDIQVGDGETAVEDDPSDPTPPAAGATAGEQLTT